MSDAETKPETPQDEEKVEDNEITKTKRSSSYVLTKKRAETLAKGRAIRHANIAKLQEQKAQQKQTEKQKKQEIKTKVKKIVEDELNQKPPEESEEEAPSSDDDYEVEIKRRRTYREPPRRSKPLARPRDDASRGYAEKRQPPPEPQQFRPNILFI